MRPIKGASAERFFLVGFILSLVMQTSPVTLRGLSLDPGGLVPAPIPARLAPLPILTQADLDLDGSPEDLALIDGRLSLLSSGRSVWESPSAWNVVQAAITDLDQDGIPEATLLVWRPFQAWPVDRWLPVGGRIADFHDRAGNSCQLILIGWRRDHYGEMWAGSAMAEPVRSFAVGDLDGDGRQDLVTLEGSYSDPVPVLPVLSASVLTRKLKVWDWNGFGFSVVSTYTGKFDSLALVRAASGRKLILVSK